MPVHFLRSPGRYHNVVLLLLISFLSAFLINYYVYMAQARP